MSERKPTDSEEDLRKMEAQFNEAKEQRRGFGSDPKLGDKLTSISFGDLEHQLKQRGLSLRIYLGGLGDTRGWNAVLELGSRNFAHEYAPTIEEAIRKAFKAFDEKQEQ